MLKIKTMSRARWKVDHTKKVKALSDTMYNHLKTTMERLENGGLAAWGGSPSTMYKELTAAIISAETEVATRPKTPIGGDGALADPLLPPWWNVDDKTAAKIHGYIFGVTYGLSLSITSCDAKTNGGRWRGWRRRCARQAVWRIIERWAI